MKKIKQQKNTSAIKPKSSNIHQTKQIFRGGRFVEWSEDMVARDARGRFSDKPDIAKTLNPKVGAAQQSSVDSTSNKGKQQANKSFASLAQEPSPRQITAMQQADEGLAQLVSSQPNLMAEVGGISANPEGQAGKGQQESLGNSNKNPDPNAPKSKIEKQLERVQRHTEKVKQGQESLDKARQRILDKRSGLKDRQADVESLRTQIEYLKTKKETAANLFEQKSQVKSQDSVQPRKVSQKESDKHDKELAKLDKEQKKLEERLARKDVILVKRKEAMAKSEAAQMRREQAQTKREAALRKHTEAYEKLEKSKQYQDRANKNVEVLPKRQAAEQELHQHLQDLAQGSYSLEKMHKVMHLANKLQITPEQLVAMKDMAKEELARKQFEDVHDTIEANATFHRKAKDNEKTADKLTNEAETLETEAQKQQDEANAFDNAYYQEEISTTNEDNKLDKEYADEQLAYSRETQPSKTQSSVNSDKNSTDGDIYRMIQDLDLEYQTDNYLPIYHLRQQLEAKGMSREETDAALYRLQKEGKIDLGTVQEVVAYNDEQLAAGIPQNVGGSLFFITYNTPKPTLEKIKQGQPSGLQKRISSNSDLVEESTETSSEQESSTSSGESLSNFLQQKIPANLVSDTLDNHTITDSDILAYLYNNDKLPADDYTSGLPIKDILSSATSELEALRMRFGLVNFTQGFSEVMRELDNKPDFDFTKLKDYNENSALYDNPTFVEELKAQILAINKVLDQAPQYEGQVYRGLSFSPRFKLGAKVLKTFLDKKEITLDKLSSFTSYANVAERFSGRKSTPNVIKNPLDNDYGEVGSLVLIVNNSSKGVDISNISSYSHEKEVLLPKDVKYKVVNHTLGGGKGEGDIKGVHYLTLEQID